MKVIFHADHLFEAEMLAEKLAAAGIRPFIKGGYLTGAMGELPVINLVTISVIDDDEEEGAAVIQKHFDDMAAREALEGESTPLDDDAGSPDPADPTPDAPGLT